MNERMAVLRRSLLFLVAVSRVGELLSARIRPGKRDLALLFQPALVADDFAATG